MWGLVRDWGRRGVGLGGTKSWGRAEGLEGFICCGAVPGEGFGGEERGK